MGKKKKKNKKKKNNKKKNKKKIHKVVNKSENNKLAKFKLLYKENIGLINSIVGEWLREG